MHTSAKFKGLAQKKAIEDQNERYALRLHLRAQIETLAYPPGVPPNKYIINWLASKYLNWTVNRISSRKLNVTQVK